MPRVHQTRTEDPVRQLPSAIAPSGTSFAEPNRSKQGNSARPGPLQLVVREVSEVNVLGQLVVIPCSSDHFAVLLNLQQDGLVDHRRRIPQISFRHFRTGAAPGTGDLPPVPAVRWNTRNPRPHQRGCARSRFAVSSAALPPTSGVRAPRPNLWLPLPIWIVWPYPPSNNDLRIELPANSTHPQCARDDHVFNGVTRRQRYRRLPMTLITASLEPVSIGSRP